MSQSLNAYSKSVIDRDEAPITTTNSSIFVPEGAHVPIASINSSIFVSEGTQAPATSTNSSIFVSEDILTTITCAEKDRLIVQLIRANQELRTALAKINTENVELAERGRTLAARVGELQAMLRRESEGLELVQNTGWDFSPVDWNE
ncbi:uncharacterized protein STEHIDRAFT_159766 [Stereum hirsutum FP-91666 SS1]|uniref:uncharacterized protein n=1 Tax=Stereum hirsutum (strain FP-91666) TaxID=721885 RepID=UPI000444995E|nr:uncharacterized protein STEHIDRAFT_159766 [Stereum hirsutum FP-91666 SS1]EIM83166.1 hypothetical protein STEHIDRAFT_159766 [Stereum hirsutum FP-91666 SS1]